MRFQVQTVTDNINVSQYRTCLKHTHTGTDLAAALASLKTEMRQACRYQVGHLDVEESVAVLELIDVGQSSGVRIVLLQTADSAPVVLVKHRLETATRNQTKSSSVVKKFLNCQRRRRRGRRRR